LYVWGGGAWLRAGGQLGWEKKYKVEEKKKGARLIWEVFFFFWGGGVAPTPALQTTLIFDDGIFCRFSEKNFFQNITI